MSKVEYHISVHKNLLKHKNLISLVKNYPVVYLPPSSKRKSKKQKVKYDSAWEKISVQLGQPINACKWLWTKIVHTYAKLMILIETGKVTKEVAMSCPQTCRYFDGILSFIDPFLPAITDESIPYHTHKAINDLFGIQTVRVKNLLCKETDIQFVTHEQVKALLQKRQFEEENDEDSIDSEFLQSVVVTAIKPKLKELLQKKFKLSNKPVFTSVSSENIQKENTTKRLNLGLESELIIEDDVKTEVEDGILEEDEEKEENLTLVVNRNNPTNLNNDLENIVPDTEIMKNTVRGLNDDVMLVNTNNIEIGNSNESAISDDCMKKFFMELGEVMSMELTIDKQKILQSRINALLQNYFSKEEG